MTRPSRRLPKDILTALRRSRQVVPGRRHGGPAPSEWDFDALDHGVGRLVDDPRYQHPCVECDEPTTNFGYGHRGGRRVYLCVTCTERET